MATSGDRRRCAGCGESLKGEAVLAMNRLWHPDHFKCTACQSPIKHTFQENKARPYCIQCYAEEFNPKCNGCGKTLTDTCVMAMDKHWHQACFVCTDCKKPFPSGEYYLVDQQPYDLDCHWGKRLEKHSQSQTNSASDHPYAG